MSAGHCTPEFPHFDLICAVAVFSLPGLTGKNKDGDIMIMTCIWPSQRHRMELVLI